MTLNELKLVTALLLFLTSLLSGYASIALSTKYTRFRSTGNAIANGVFIGVALFHLIPTTLHTFEALQYNEIVIPTFGLIVASYACLLLIDKGLKRLSTKLNRILEAWTLAIIISIHAFITGVTLGISETFALVWILFLAIIIHKSFETFALVVNLQRNLRNPIQVWLLMLLFVFISPFAILLGKTLTTGALAHFDTALTAWFNAIAAGTFLYIGTAHTAYEPIHTTFDGYQRYSQILATLTGVAIMGIAAIWV